MQIEGVNTKEDVAWYCGKRMAYIYKAKTKSSGTHYRCIWGKVTRPHGNSGVVRAKFRSNLPPESMVSWSAPAARALPFSIRRYVLLCILCSVLILFCCPPFVAGPQGQGLHVPQQHLKVSVDCNLLNLLLLVARPDYC